MLHAIGNYFKRHSVENLLKIKLPRHIQEIEFYKNDGGIGSDTTLYRAYIKLKMPVADYIWLVQQIDRITNWTGIPANQGLLFPAEWKTLQDINLDWWAPSINVSETTATWHFKNGWIVANHEGDHAYLLVKGFGFSIANNESSH